jgi:hypothetical protein
MVQIQISGPAHSRRGYLMVEIARVLRGFGCNVILQGEGTHLAQKVELSDAEISEKLAGVEVRITELQT